MLPAFLHRSTPSERSIRSTSSIAWCACWSTSSYLPSQRASIICMRTASWATNDLVAATLISGPARIKSVASAILLAELPRTLVMVRVRQLCIRACLSAVSVSAVSPDWVIPITRPSSGGWKYRNSEAKSTRAGILQDSSSRYLNTSPAWYDEPQATTDTDEDRQTNDGKVCLSMALRVLKNAWGCS